MNKHRVFEIICVVFLAVFIFVMSGNDSYSDKTVEDVFEFLPQSTEFKENCQKIGKNKIKEEFGIDFEEIDSFIYYASDAIMTVDELMIIKLVENAKADNIIEKIEKRVNEKQILFEGYAPEQSALLKNYDLSYTDGFIFYCVSENSTDAMIYFWESLK